MRRAAGAVMEDWRPVPGFPLYEASNLGRVRRKPGTGRRGSGKREALKPCPNGAGYLSTRLMRDGVAHSRTVHRVVCETFHGPQPSPHHEVGFRDDARTNCAADNLFWRTRTEERAHRRETGAHREGERVPWARLRAAQIPEIRRRLARGETCSAIAHRLGVSEGAINGIRIGRNWKHV